jgi:surfactin synthase thioesterase subunit
LKNIKKPENLYKIALENSNLGLKAFHKIASLSPEQYAELTLKSVDPDVRKAALPYVKDLKVLKSVLFNDPNIGADALPAFKDDMKTLEQAFLKAKDEKVVSNLASRIKNQDILKTMSWRQKTGAKNKLPRKLYQKSKTQSF